MGVFEGRFATRDAGIGGQAFAAIDVGAGKIVCLIAAAKPEPEIALPIDVLGVAAVPLRRGEGGGPDPDSQVYLARVAIDQAARMAGDRLPPFAAAYGGPDLVSFVAEGGVRLRGPVGPRDVAGAIAAARSAIPLAGRRLLHASPLRYRLDDGEPVADPRGLEGEMLFADVCLAHAPAEAVAALEATLEAAGAAPSFVVAAPFAAGHGVLTPEERETGAIVVDVGEAGVGVAVFQHGVLRYAATLSGGGGRLTRDLAARLRTSVAVAERAKLLHGGLTGEGDPTDAVEVPVIGADGRLEPGMALRGAFVEALLPRLEEILAGVARRLDAADFGPEDAAFGVALTGGVSQTPGLRTVAARVLQRPVRIAQPLGFGGFDDSVTGGGYAVATGLVRCGLERATTPASATGPVIDPRAVSRKVGGALTWLKENF
ncbi:MAG: cell division protein FtsA [Hyphomonadaceae bacterium]|nr:cell division protein FtsA [Hyphomonadaceae bacterium]